MCEVGTACGSGRAEALRMNQQIGPPATAGGSDSIPMKQKITGFDKDDEDHWRALLECGHRQHLRHDPPMTTRTWVLTDEGRASRIGFQLECKRCDEEPDALNE